MTKRTSAPKFVKTPSGMNAYRRKTASGKWVQKVVGMRKKAR